MSPIAPKLAVLALAGSALAAPSFGGHHGHKHQHKHFFGGSSGAATGTGAPYGIANATGIWGTGSSGFAASTGLRSEFVHPSPVGLETASETALAASETTSTCTDSVVRVTHTNRVTVTVHQSEAAPAATTLTSSSAAASSSETASLSLNLDLLQNKAYNAKGHRKWGQSSSTSAAAAATTSKQSSSVYVAPASTSTSSSTPVVVASSTKVSSVASVVSSSTQSAASSTNSVVAKSTTGKRGVAYNDASLTTGFESYDQVTWGYNWASGSSGLSSSFNFVPLLWGDSSSFTNGWNAAATSAIASGSTHLMSFNEPDLSTQSNISPEDAAAAYKTWMMPFAGKAKLGAPAVTNGANGMGLDWLAAFLDACDDCQIDFVAIHWYESATNIDYFKEQVSNATSVAGGKPVWVTEFGCTSGSDSDIATFLQTVMPWMDSQDYVERYSYFMASDGILVSGTEPSTLGTTFASYTSS